LHERPSDENVHAGQSPQTLRAAETGARPGVQASSHGTSSAVELSLSVFMEEAMGSGSGDGDG
jgi:hypothetical protein